MVDHVHMTVIFDWVSPEAPGGLTLSPPNKFSSANFFVCFKFQSASMLLKVAESIVCVSNSLDPGETLSYSASHPDQSCLQKALVVLGSLGLKHSHLC